MTGLDARLAIVLNVALSTAMLGCSPKATTPLRPQTLVVFPAPPDTARVQFLTRISGEQDIAGYQGPSFWDRLVGEDPSEAGGKQILKPYGVAVGRGKIYVCDTRLPGIDIIDLAERTFEYLTPVGEGRLRQPFNCFVDRSDGLLYVADIARREIVVFDGLGNFLHTVGNPLEVRPTDVFVSGDKIWVSDMEGREIEVYDKTTRERLFTFPDQELRGPGRLYSPTNLSVAGDRVYVSDFGSFNVKIYSIDGEYLGTVGSYGDRLGQFTRPKGIAVDRESNLYVVDAAFDNVQIFSRDGDLLMFMGGPYVGPGYMWLPAKVVVDYENLEYFRQYVHEGFDLKHLIFVTNQFGPDKLSVYGFVGPREEMVADDADRIVGENARRQPR